MSRFSLLPTPVRLRPSVLSRGARCFRLVAQPRSAAHARTMDTRRGYLPYTLVGRILGGRNGGSTRRCEVHWRRHSKMLQVSEVAVHGVLVSKEPVHTTCSWQTYLSRSLENRQKVVPRPILSLWTCRGGEERHGQHSLMRLIPNREAAHQIGLVDRITRLTMFPR